MSQSKLLPATFVLASMVRDLYWNNLRMISLPNSMARSQENIHLTKVYLAMMEQKEVRQGIPNNVPNTQPYLNSKHYLLREKYTFKKHWTHLSQDTLEPICRSFWRRRAEATSTFTMNSPNRWLISDYLQQQIFIFEDL